MHLPFPLPAQQSDIEWIIWDDFSYYETLAVSPDGKHFALAGIDMPGNEIRIYSLQLGELTEEVRLHSIITNRQLLGSSNASETTYLTFDFLSDTSLFLSHRFSDTLTKTTHAPFVVLNLEGRQIKELPKGHVSIVGRSPYAAGVLVAGNSPAGPTELDTFSILNLYTDKLTTTTTHYLRSERGNTLLPLMSPDGSALVLTQRSGLQNTYQLIETASGQRIHEQTFTVIPKFTALLPDNRSLLILEIDHVLKVLDLQTGGLERRVVSGELAFLSLQNYGFALSNDGRYLAISQPDGTIDLWHVPTGKKIHVFDDYQGAFTNLVFTSDGQHLITTTMDGALISWRIPAGWSGVENEEEASDSQLSCTSLFNPATRTFRFTYRLSERADVSVDLYNLQGERIGGLVEVSVEEGEHHIEWQEEKIPAGVYFYRLRAGDGFAAGRIAVPF